MKTYIINEHQQKLLVNEAMSDQFSFETLKQLSRQSFNAMIKYCRQNLGFSIGSGSSRICFQLDDNWILKLAKNKKGIIQNELESRQDWYLNKLGIFPKVDYDRSDMENSAFIVSEYVLPATKADIKHCFGIDYETFRNVCKAFGTREYGKLYDFILTLCDNESPVCKWEDYIGNYEIPWNEVSYIKNLGLVNRENGPEIVILDSGVNNEIIDKYYSL